MTAAAFEERAVMSPKTFRKRNLMSNSEWHRRRERQRNGEPGSEDLLPTLTRLSEKRYGVRYIDEAVWQQKRLVAVATTGQRRARAHQAAE
jgi:hypothetical protein